MAQLEELRQTHDLDPAFTLRFGKDDTIEVIVGRPDDDGRFGLTALEENGIGEFTVTAGRFGTRVSSAPGRWS